MTTEEFSNEFDVLINTQATINSFGITASPTSIDEYEKSVLLTKAQEEIVRALYNGTLKGESVEETEELRRSLDSLIKTDYPIEITIETPKGLDSNSKFYQLKDDVWFITYESVELTNDSYCKNKKIVKVIPMKQDEWHRSKDNPFRRPNKRKVVRLDNGNNISELISEYPIQNYLIRYLSKPTPIILTELEGDLSIDNLKEKTECKLNSALHRIILERAVQLALTRIPTKAGD